MKHEHNFLLRRERELRGWSLQKVADELHRLFQDSNATAADIGRWERGVRAPSPFYREKLCILYGKGADELGLIKIADSDEYAHSTGAKRAFSTSVKEQFWQNEQNVAISRPAESLLEEWGEAPHVGSFYGRNQESAKLEKWIIDEHCRVVAILGIGGIGKTALTKTVVEQIKNHFEYVFWRSLQHAPPLKNVLRDCIVFLSHQKQMEIPQDEDDQISLLIEYLRNRRCLLVLDNAESVLREGYRAGHYREGYEGYGKLIQSIGEIPLQSCLLLTSREKLQELIRLEGNISPIHSLHLLGLKEEEGKAILKDEGVFGSQKAWKDLIRRYTGNPLALKLVAEPIRELFGGDIAEFLKEEGALVDNNVYTLLHQQFLRLSELEQDILYWLAIEREAIVLEEMRTDLVRPTSKRELLSALTSLRQRYMIETNGVARFTLQPVIMEYVTDRLLEEIYKEIETEKLHFFSSHALIKANTKDYLRYSQIQLILQPLVYKIYALFGKIGIVKRLIQILSVLRDTNSQVPSYAAGNVLNLLIQSHVNLRGYDFSHLVIWEAYLQGVSLPEVNFAHADLERSVFTDTFGGIFSVAFSPGGDLLAGGIANGEVRLWYVKGTPRYVLHGHTDWVRSVAFSPDGRVVASGSYDQTVRLWEVSTGRCLKTLQGHTGRVYSVTFAPDGTMVASGSGDQTICLWDAHTGESLRTLYDHSDAVHCIAFGPDRNTLVSGSGDQTIRLWNTHTGQCLHVFHGHSGAILTVALSPDGELLASGSEDQTIKIWEVSTGQCIETLSEYTNQIWSVVFGRGKNAFLYGSEDQYIKIWEVSKEQCLKVLQGHSNKIWSLALSPDGELLASGSEDQTIKIWEVNTGQCLKTFQGYSNWVYTVVFSPDGKTLISGGQESYIRLWSINENKCEKTLQGHKSWIYTVVFSPDGKTLASGSEDQTIKIWEVSTGQCLKTLQGHSSWVRSVVFSPDGKTLASGSEDNTIRIWDLHMGQCMRILYGHSSWVRSVAFSPDGNSIISGSEDQTIRIWDVDTGQCRSILRDHTSRIYSVAVSSNGLVVASGSGDGTIKLWEVSTEALLKTLQGHSTWVRSITFSPDGKNLVSGSADQTIRIWEVATGECLRILQGHSSWVYSVAFNFDGKIIASGSGDGTIKLWNIHTGMCIMTLRNDRPYERMNITQVKGVTLARKSALQALGAIEEVKEVSNHG